MKDYIEIELENKEKIKAEVILTYKLENYPLNYIVYKVEKNYYVAKYKGENIVDLITDLTDQELKLSETILKGVIKQ